MKILEQYATELVALEEHMRNQSRSGEVLEVLEAGCGREWYFKMQGIDYVLTGIDTDIDALTARQNLKKDLSHCIVGDLRTVQLPPEKYDVIYNAFVLEHVDGAEKVLQNFVAWLKPGGIMIIRVPDSDGVQGFVARFTPHFFHVFYYRWAWKMKNAGKPGYAPYPTFYDHVISRQGLRDFCASHKLEVLEEFGVGSYRRGYGIISKITPLVARAIAILSLGRIHDKFVDRTLIARKVRSLTSQ